MKKALILIAVVAIFFGCKKDDNSSATPIVGKWHLTADTAKTFTAGSVSGTQINPLTTQGNSDLQFYRNGEFDLYDQYTYTDRPTYTQDGSNLTLNTPSHSNGSTTIAASTRVYTIRQLDTKKMVLFYQSITGGTGSSSVQYYVKLN